MGYLNNAYCISVTSIVSTSNLTKCVILSNQKSMTQHALIILHPNEYSQESHYYPFAIKLDKCVGSWNNINDLSYKVFVTNKIEDLKIHLFLTWLQ